MVEAMLLGGLRRCEVLGLRLLDIQVADKRPSMRRQGRSRADGPGSQPVFTTLAADLDCERPAGTAMESVSAAPKGHGGTSADGGRADEILRGARHRAGLHATCDMLRHTRLTRLREAGMAREAVQAQAGHRSIESTRI